jgi:hypothetical protein
VRPLNDRRQLGERPLHFPALIGPEFTARVDRDAASFVSNLDPRRNPDRAQSERFSMALADKLAQMIRTRLQELGERALWEMLRTRLAHDASIRLRLHGLPNTPSDGCDRVRFDSPGPRSATRSQRPRESPFQSKEERCRGEEAGRRQSPLRASETGCLGAGIETLRQAPSGRQPEALSR